MKENRWTIRSTEWQKKGVWSVGSPVVGEMCGATGSIVDKDSKGQRKLRTLVGGYFLQWKDTA